MTSWRFILWRAGGRCEACGARTELAPIGGGDPATTWAACPSCRRRLRAPVRYGRLLTEAHGGGRFTFRYVTGPRHERVVFHEWTIGA